MYQKGRAWIELNRENLLHNVKEFRSILAPSCKIMAAVKANAYGHGAVEIAKILQEAKVNDFCVATVSEGIELRQAGIDGQILILGYTHPKRLEELVQYDLTQTVVDASYGYQLQQFGKKIKVHICIDTGMHRLGERFEKIEDILAMWEIPNLHITGIYSHLCVADNAAETDRDYTLYQIANFRQVIASLDKAGKTGYQTHMQSSYGVLNYPEFQFDYARLGIALYGSLSEIHDVTKVKADLKPVLSLKSRIQSVKVLNKGEGAGYGLTYIADHLTKIAAVSIGYADGVSRSLSNCGYVLIHGKRAAIIGRICMDQLLIDITDIPDAAPGEEVVLIGSCGEEEITACLFASWTNTITNEVFSRFGSRLERIVV